MSTRKLTTDQAKFQKAWEYHINELNSLAFQANASMEEIKAVKDTLNGWIHRTTTMKEGS